VRDPTEGHRAATWLELFFDLCFVVAVSALARDLHHHPDAAGLLRFLGLLVPVWWAWMAYTWFATAFDNDDATHRVGFLSAGLGILWLAASVEAVGHGGDASFALAYAFVLAVLVVLFVRVRLADTDARPWAHRSAIGNALGMMCWLVSPLLPETVRPAAWIAGMALLMATPMLAVRTLLGHGYRVRIFHPGHIRERYGLFAIIVLGESLLAVASGTSGADWSVPAVVAGVAGFGLAAATWWLYFGHTASDALTLSARAAFLWGYGHLFIYAGIAGMGVGVQLVVESVADGAAPAVAEGARLVLTAAAATFLAAMAFIAATAAPATDPRVRERAAGALMVGLVGVLAMVGGLTPAVLLITALGTVVTLTVLQERRTRVQVIAHVS
jgi:low temperature requirement protein LtrA